MLFACSAVIFALYAMLIVLIHLVIFQFEPCILHKLSFT